MSKLEENPRRPPREWWYRCTAGVEESNRLYGRDVDPSSVCGSLWYHKMRAADKRLIVQKAEEKKMSRNPKSPLLKRASLRSREGTRVRFEATPASLALYSSPPKRFLEGTITSVNTGSGRRTSIPGPGGGLVYVKWDDGSFQGVSPLDLVVLPTFAPNPAGGGGMLALAALAAAGIAWLVLRGKTVETPKLVGPSPKPAPPYVSVTCVIKKEMLDAWGKVHGISILVSDPVGTAYPLGATTLPLVVWNEGENYLRAVNNVTTPDALATKSYCEWVAHLPSLAPPNTTPPPPTAPPPPPPTPAPSSEPQSAALQGGGATGITIYLMKRLFVWTGSSWKLEDNFDAYLPPTESYSGAAYMSFKASPTFPQTATASPPYYFADVWEWSNGAWKKIHCAVNYTAPGCQREG